MIIEGFHIDTKNFGINSKREKKWEMHEKRIDIKKVLKFA